MTADNYALLKNLIDKTLDDTYKNKVLEYFNQGKLTEKEKNDLFEYLKIIDNIVLAERGVHKNKVEFVGDTTQAGWKIHLAVEPKNYQYVFRWLVLNGPYDFKHLHGGETEAGKDFTIYNGSWDDMFAFAQVIQEKISGRLKIFDQRVYSDCMRVLPNIGARFQLPLAIASDTGLAFKGKQYKFFMYGWNGVSFLHADMMTLLEYYKVSLVKLYRQKIIDDHCRKILFVRAYNELVKMYGTYFFGAKRSNMLTAMFDKFEQECGSELPMPAMTR